MIDTIYIEREIQDHPRSQRIYKRFPRARRILCERYGEVFNRNAQNFRLQKRRPSLILARKFDHFVLAAPPEYGIGGDYNYYFSHMLNCLYDCRYCFLQGMYRSAHYLLFVNYEDFQQAIAKKIQELTDQNKKIYFFSGYDCDSLALEAITHFVEEFLPFFANHPQAWLELRTKSSQGRCLLQTQPLANCIVASSFTPKVISQALEHKVPPVHQRTAMLQKLQRQGWQIGLRFDPLIYHEEYKQTYRQLFAQIFAQIDPNHLHSVSIGTFRLPKGMHQRIQRLYPDEKLFASKLSERQGMVSFEKKLADEMMQFCIAELRQYLDDKIIFPCENGPQSSDI